MKKTRYTESQIIKVLNEVEGGRAVKDVCREYTVYRCNVLQLEVDVRWYGGLGDQKAE